MARNYAALPHDYLEEMEELTDAEFGRLVRALLVYSRSGEQTALCGNERFYFRRVIMQEDRFQDSYDESASGRSKAGKKGAAARWGIGQNDTQDGKNGKNSKAISANGKNGNIETKTKTDTETNLSGADAPDNAREDAAQCSGVRNPELAKVMSAYMDRVNPTPSQICVEELRSFTEQLGAEVCIHAMDVALDERHKEWSYIKGILRRYGAEGVHCLADIKARDKKHWENRKHGEKNAPKMQDKFQRHDGELSPIAKQAVARMLLEEGEA